MKKLTIILFCCSLCFGDIFTSHIKPKTDSTLDIGTSSLMWREIFADSYTDGVALWSGRSLSGFTSISGITLTDGTFIVTGGVITAGTWHGTDIDISDYTNLAVSLPIILTGDTLSLQSPLTVPDGGTGNTFFIEGGLLYGNSTGAIQALAVATNGQIPIGDGTFAPTLATITAGDAIDITNGAGSILIDVNYPAINAHETDPCFVEWQSTFDNNETDPCFTISSAHNITDTNRANWQSAYNHSQTGATEDVNVWTDEGGGGDVITKLHFINGHYAGRD